MHSTRNHSYRNDPAYPRPIDEFCDEAAAEFLAFQRDPRWGGWTFDPTWLLLRNDELPWYQIDLHTCRSSEDVLDWLVQVRDRYSPEQLARALGLGVERPPRLPRAPVGLPATGQRGHP